MAKKDKNLKKEIGQEIEIHTTQFSVPGINAGESSQRDDNKLAGYVDPWADFITSSSTSQKTSKKDLRQAQAAEREVKKEETQSLKPVYYKRSDRYITPSMASSGDTHHIDIEARHKPKKNFWKYFIPISIGTVCTVIPVYLAIVMMYRPATETAVEKFWGRYDEQFARSIKAFDPQENNSSIAKQSLVVEEQLSQMGLSELSSQAEIDITIKNLETSANWESSQLKIALDKLKNMIYYHVDFADTIDNIDEINHNELQMNVSFALSVNPNINNYTMLADKSYSEDNLFQQWTSVDDIITFGAGYNTTVFDLFAKNIYSFLQGESTIGDKISGFTPAEIDGMFDSVENSPLAEEKYFGGVFETMKIASYDIEGNRCTPVVAYQRAFFNNPDSETTRTLNVKALVSHLIRTNHSNGSEALWWITEENIRTTRLLDVPYFAGTSYDNILSFTYKIDTAPDMPKQLADEQRWNTFGRKTVEYPRYVIDDNYDDYNELAALALKGGDL